MRPKKSKSRGHDPPTTNNRTSHSNGNASIEMTTQRKRDLLASVGFLEEDEELPDVQLAGSIKSNRNRRQRNTVEEEYYHEKEERRRRKQQMKNSHSIDFDEVDFDYEDKLNDENYLTEDDDLLSNSNEVDDYSDCSQEDVQSPGGSRCCHITTKLIFILAMVAAFIYIFGDDSNTTENPEQEPAKHEYFSYKGYKDGRIPDDDVAQFGGGVLFQNEDNTNNIDDEASIDYDQDVKSSIEAFAKHETGVPNEESIWQDLAGYADLSEPYNPEEGDVAFFWHVPKCGGTTLQDLMMHCIGMVGANEVGGSYVNDGPLQIVQMENGNRYVNVDVTQPDGIQHAHILGFASSGLADVAMSSRFHNVASLFVPDAIHTSVAKARCFTLLRHPVRRAISMFYYLRDATWEHTYSEIYKSMTIEEYAVSQYAEDNWMGEFLSSLRCIIKTIYLLTYCTQMMVISEISHK